MLIDSPTLFGRCIAQLRKDLGLSQAEFARQIRMSRQAITRIESGKSTLSFFALMRLSFRIDRKRSDALALFALFDLCVDELQDAGIRVVNRNARPGDDLVPTARLDRFVGHVFEQEFERFTDLGPGRVAEFQDDDDDDEIDD